MILSWYWKAYGHGSHTRVSGKAKDTNPFTYGTHEYDAWNDGWEMRK